MNYRSRAAFFVFAVRSTPRFYPSSRFFFDTFFPDKSFPLPLNFSRPTPYPPAMNEIELLKVADAVDATPPENFNMRSWKCDSVVCAIGSYCQQNPNSPLKLEVGDVYGIGVPVFHRSLRYKSTGYEAVSDFFVIDTDDSEYLFSSLSYESSAVERSIVSARIRRFVSENK